MRGRRSRRSGTHGRLRRCRGQAAAVDDRLQRQLGCLRGQRRGGLEEVELAPAQLLGKIGKTAVAGG